MRIFIVIAFAACVYSLPHRRTKRNGGKIYDIVDIAVTNGLNRTKRSPSDDLPQSLNVEFTAKGKETKIRLRKSAGINVPVYEMVDGEAVKKNVPRNRRSAVFHDADTGTPVQVTVSGDGDSVDGKKFELEGILNLNSNNLAMSPNGSKHVLRDIDNLSYGDDEVFAAVESSNLTITEMKAAIHEGNRTRRSLNIFTVEMLIVCDESVLARFRREYAEEDVYSAIQSYLELLFYTTQLRLDTITDIYYDVVVKIEMAGLLLLEDDQAPFKTNNFDYGYVQASPAIDDFGIWVEANGDALPKNDHVMWLTDELLADDEDTGTIGIAFIGGACGEYKVSIVEDFYTALTALIAAHELAHNLDSLHDSEEGCSDDDYYIMSAKTHFPAHPSMINNPFQFSDCSATMMVYFLVTMDESSCLRVDDNGELDHQTVLADMQCKLAMDNVDSFFCRYEQAVDSAFDLMCINLNCFNPDSDECEGGHIAYDHTSCGDGKWCIKGECVSDSAAPPKAANCPQGELPGYDCDINSCDSYFGIDMADCCETCDFRPNDY